MATEHKIQFPEIMRFLFHPKRYKIGLGGRGGLKSWSFAQALLILAAERPLRILCARETMKSIKDSVHLLLSDQIVALGLQDKFHVLDKEIVGIGENNQGTLFRFAGLLHNISNIKSIESFDIVWVEEAQSVSDDSWRTLIPTIRKENSFGIGFHSEIWISFNPRLATDPTYVRFFLKPPKQSVVKFTTWLDNPFLPQPLRDEAMELYERDYNEYLHVYMGECLRTIKGAIFEAEMQAVDDERRIKKVPYDPRKPVITVWDLGFYDMVFVWFVQIQEGRYNFIDTMQGNRQSIHSFLIEMQKRKYIYGKVLLPYDGVDTIIHSKLGGSRKMSIEMIIKEMGYKVQIVPKVKITDRINAARMILPLCHFDEEKCRDGLTSLRMYHWPDVNDAGVGAKEPVHDQSSHASEAFTRAGQMLPFLADKEALANKPKARLLLTAPAEFVRGVPLEWQGDNEPYTPFG